jgi:Flp pilus assembly pilin Flp
MQFQGRVFVSDFINNLFVRAYLRTKREEGQTFVEYALIGLLVAVAVAASVTLFEGKISTALGTIGGKL